MSRAGDPRSEKRPPAVSCPDGRAANRGGRRRRRLRAVGPSARPRPAFPACALGRNRLRRGPGVHPSRSTTPSATAPTCAGSSSSRGRRRTSASSSLSQDVIVVGGGNTANMLAIWRVHGFDTLLREAWEQGIVLTGVSAGMICWFEAGVTDSFGPQLEGMRDGLGLLPGSACPHYDGEERRRPVYRQLVERRLPRRIRSRRGRRAALRRHGARGGLDDARGRDRLPRRARTARRRSTPGSSVPTSRSELRGPRQCARSPIQIGVSRT